MVARARESWRRAGKPGRVKAAVSGGADSVALLLVLHALSQGFSLSCIHVDHGLRPDSAADAAFVAGLCGRLGVPCRVIPLKLKGKSEDEAKRLCDVFMRMITGTVTDEELESLDEAAALQDIAKMPARVKCAELGWRTMKEALGPKA